MIYFFTHSHSRQDILWFVMKHGTVVSFRYLFKTGPDRPEQREYVFVEYSTREVHI